MANLRLVFAIIFVLLIFVTGFLFVSNASKSSKIEKAERLSGEVYEYFSNIKEICRARPDDFDKMTECMEKLNEKIQRVGDIEEDEFQEFDEETNESGYLIVVNDGRSSLNSSLFTLTKNRKVMDEGCVIEGKIDSGYTCKMFFNSTCESGDVLEVTYDGTRAYLKTC